MSSFDYEDRVTITTPEGVELQLTLAGVGSRFVAALLDVLVEGALLLVLALLVFLSNGFGTGRDGAEAIFAVVWFGVFWGYDVAFEVLAAGRTPGKRWSGLRVVRQGGQPVGFVASATRNLLRIIDLLPVFYLIGIVSILVTAKNQRLGDLVAGTVVVRELRGADRPLGALVAPITGATRADWDLTAINAAELAAVRQFLERRPAIELSARHELAALLAARLRPKAAGVPAELGDERFLEALINAKREGTDR